MGLPKQKYMSFSITIPSTGEKHKFRPFTVKEDNILSQAKESEDKELISNAVIDIINGCFMNKLDATTLATFDLEFILTNIRAKSVGEMIDISLGCSESSDHKKTVIRVDLTKPQVVFPEGHTKNIPLYDNVGVIMRYPNISEILELEGASAIESVILCIDSIYNGEEIFPKNDHTKDELKEFVETLTRDQLKDIKSKFFDKTPEYKLTIEYECVECKHKNTRVVKGLNNFFI